MRIATHRINMTALRNKEGVLVPTCDTFDYDIKRTYFWGEVHLLLFGKYSTEAELPT